MKKVLFVTLLSLAQVFSGASAKAKLSDQQSMKCIDSDNLTKSAFQDLQAAYEMRLLTAKDFFKVMEKPASCPQLKKDLKKLHSTALASLPRVKKATRIQPNRDYTPSDSSPRINDYGADVNDQDFSNHDDFNAFPPPPPPFPDDTFEGDFDEF